MWPISFNNLLDNCNTFPLKYNLKIAYSMYLDDTVMRIFQLYLD